MQDPLCLVDEVTPGSEGHHIVHGATGKPRYRVGWGTEEEAAGAAAADPDAALGCAGSCVAPALVAVVGAGMMMARRML